MRATGRPICGSTSADPIARRMRPARKSSSAHFAMKPPRGKAGSTPPPRSVRRSMPRIEPVDLPGKGRFWRLRLGFESASDARAVCAELKSRGIDCLVVRD
jgi:SPOR domain